MVIRYNGKQYVIYVGENCNNEEFERFKEDLREVTRDQMVQYKNSLDYDVTFDSDKNCYYLHDNISEMVRKGAYKSNSIWLDNGKFIILRSLFSGNITEILKDGKFWFYLTDNNDKEFINSLVSEIIKLKED